MNNVIIMQSRKLNVTMCNAKCNKTFICTSPQQIGFFAFITCQKMKKCRLNLVQF